MASTTPIPIHIPPTLRHRAIPLTEFLQTHPQYTTLAIGSLIFSSPSSHCLPPATSTSTSASAEPLRLLLVQRAATERGFPNLWEVPGGSSELTDPTILHSAARETFEETGLRLTRFVREIGNGLEFVTGWGSREKKWLKLSFEIEVQEMRGHGSGEKHAPRVGTVVDNGTKGEQQHRASDGADSVGNTGLSITLDPGEHQDFAWATEEEIKAGKYPIVTPDQCEVMTQGFALKKAEKGKRKAASGSSEVFT